MIAEVKGFVDIEVAPWVWLATLAVIVGLLLFDILILHRTPHAPKARRAAIETIAWALVGVAFGIVVFIGYGSKAGGEWFAGWLIEYSLSIDNVFVWALILTYFRVPSKYQHRVLFWGVFGALVLRAGFVFAGVALVERFEITLFIFGGFLLYTSAKLLIGTGEESDPTKGRFYRMLQRLVPTTPELDGQRLFTRANGRRLATPLFVVLLLIEATDVLFAVDSVPAVLAVSKTQFIVFTSNAFAIMGLRSLYFLLADMHARFGALQQGLAIILAFVGVKMIISRWYHIDTAVSLLVIVLVLGASVAFSVRQNRVNDALERIGDSHAAPEPMPPADER
ncbi:MAG: putative TerC family integral rane protein [Ilumatobacteraceae bacterium]|nr:putative TerC family integral rane protein [Ilumatobacteraceae bacterium]